MPRRPFLTLPFGFALGGCNWEQSTLAPSADHAAFIAKLTWLLFFGGGVILTFVMLLVAVAILAPRGLRLGLEHPYAIIVGGVLFPLVTLTALLVYTLFGWNALEASTAKAIPLRIEVIGERWWWRVNYLDDKGERFAIAANEVRMPVGRPVEFILTTSDVIHSFWIPSLGGKLDMIPGRANRYRITAQRPGIYRGQCAEYCGAQHALMAFYAVAVEPGEFDAWLAHESAPAEPPRIPVLEKGQQLFLGNGCGACHVVRGTPANGQIGPDLTHFGSRLSIAAGTYPNNIGTIAGWISSSQHLKPENLMPSFGNLTGEELRLIASYVESLK